MRKFFIVMAAVPIVALGQMKYAERENGIAVFSGMGVAMVSASDLVGYINATAIPSQRVNDFTAAIEFFGGIEIPISAAWGVKFEHQYMFSSVSFTGTNGGLYDIFYALNTPSVLIQHVLTGRGYFVKIGAGAGYHFGKASQKISTFGVETEYAAHGFGGRGEIVGQTAFDENFFGYIGGQLAWGWTGTLHNASGTALSNTIRSTSASLDHFSAGLRFGVMYYF
jgi:hypothetical protein